MKTLVFLILFTILSAFLPQVVLAASAANMIDGTNRKKLVKKVSKVELARRAAAANAARQRRAAQARLRAAAFESSLKTKAMNSIALDNIEGENLVVRNAAIAALGKRSGSIVVMDSQTGELITLVNQAEAVRQSVKPCSVIKLVTGAAALNANAIDDPADLEKNLAKSKNSYFQKTGANIGGNKLGDIARKMGLGQPTGINLPGEVSGKLPYGLRGGRIYSHGDGTEVTPLQLAVMVTAITTKGKIVKPYVRTKTGNLSLQATNKQVDLPLENLQGLIPGMKGSTEYGTGRPANVEGAPKLGIAGKTGSCIEHGTWVGLFASVAPIEQPKYTVVVITHGRGARGRYSAEIAGKIYQALAGLNPVPGNSTATGGTASVAVSLP